MINANGNIAPRVNVEHIPRFEPPQFRISTEHDPLDDGSLRLTGPVWLVGDGRSGTTWLLEMLNHDCGWKVLFEPFHPEALSSSGGFVPFQHIPSLPDGDLLADVVDAVFHGRFHHPRCEPYTPVPAGESALTHGLLVKDIFAHLMLPWCMKRHPEIRPILLLRHPFAVALSKVRLTGSFWAREPDSLLAQDSLRAAFPETWKEALAGARTPFRKFVAIWCAVHRMLLSLPECANALVVFYEDLLCAPESELRRIFAWIGKPLEDCALPETLRKAIAKPSSQSVSPTETGAQARLCKWMVETPRGEIEYGLELLRIFGMDGIYGASAMPDASKLRDLAGKTIIGWQEAGNVVPNERQVFVPAVTDARVGFGSLGRGGLLGYDTPCSCGIELGDLDGGDTVFSAHAPSRLTINLPGPARVYGAMNGTSHPCRSGYCHFTVDGQPIGRLCLPYERTACVELAPGAHELLVTCKDNTGQHSVWIIQPAEPGKPSGKGTPVQLALATIACYPAADAAEVLWPLARSARRSGHALHVMGVDTHYGTHAETKIHRLLEWVRGMDAEHILFADGRDSLVIGGSEEILSEFRSFGTDFVVSMEKECWPVKQPAWTDSFPKQTDRRNWPNAGGWIGTKSGVVRVLTEAIRRQQALRIGISTDPGPLRGMDLSELIENDQFLMQALYLDNRIQGDANCRIFTTIGTADSFHLSRNPEYEIRKSRVLLKSTGATPAVLHFSGPSCGLCRDQWAELLDKFCGKRSG
ncbi:MAG: sulfotransferase [Verrucomicrobia bacterium]|nr:sulfotransferase [Verrucomicrobiota bacterium]